MIVYLLQFLVPSFQCSSAPYLLVTIMDLRSSPQTNKRRRQLPSKATVPVSAAVYATNIYYRDSTFIIFGLVYLTLEAGHRPLRVSKSFGQPVIPSCSKPGRECVSPANIILYTECYSRALGACHSEVLTNLRSDIANPIALKLDRIWVSLSHYLWRFDWLDGFVSF